MEYVITVLSKVGLLILLIGSGCLAKRMKLISDQGEKDMSRLLIDFFWPALIVAKITSTLERDHLLANLTLPLAAMVTALLGYFLGQACVRMLGYTGDRKKVYLYHSTINNFVFMVLPFADMLFPENGAALVFVHNLGIILVLWTLGISSFTGGTGLKDSAKNLLSPALLATVGSILFVMAGFSLSTSSMVGTTLSVLGSAAVPIAMIIAGGQIYNMGRRALRFDLWNISLGVVRLLIVPGVLLIPALLLRGHVSREVLVIFMVVNIMPVSVNSVSLAMRYKSSPQLAAQGVVFTHLFSLITVVGWMLLIVKLFG
ncbi:hypothetical protein BVY04_01635 [bacterium M21]|nr:hypothetical protein BVY04_01635 [bacterium M21]